MLSADDAADPSDSCFTSAMRRRAMLATALDEGFSRRPNCADLCDELIRRQGRRWVAPSRRLVAAFVRLCCEDHRQLALDTRPSGGVERAGGHSRAMDGQALHGRTGAREYWTL
ncbi:hypothetical protein M4D79_13375 [Mycolicibacterium novocastrense]|nr:hypothetical protein M4D79_13375 [Mycolicibacterium novocastrense]